MTAPIRHPIPTNTVLLLPLMKAECQGVLYEIIKQSSTEYVKVNICDISSLSPHTPTTDISRKVTGCTLMEEEEAAGFVYIDIL